MPGITWWINIIYQFITELVVGCFSVFAAKLKVLPTVADSGRGQVLVNPGLVMHQRAASSASIQARRAVGAILAVASHFCKELGCH